MFKGVTWLTMLWGYLLFSAVPPIDRFLKPVAVTFSNTVQNLTRNAFSALSNNQNYYNNQRNARHRSNSDDIIIYQKPPNYY